MAIGDGNDKMRTAARHFHVPILPQNSVLTDEIEANILEELNLPSEQSRRSAVARASSEARQNYVLLNRSIAVV